MLSKMIQDDLEESNLFRRITLILKEILNFRFLSFGLQIGISNVNSINKSLIESVEQHLMHRFDQIGWNVQLRSSFRTNSNSVKLF